MAEIALKDLFETKVFIQSALKRSLTDEEEDLRIDLTSQMRGSVSLLETWELCPRKGYYGYRLRIRSDEDTQSDAQKRGDALHKALEKYVDGSCAVVADGLAAKATEFATPLREKFAKGMATVETWFSIPVGDLPISMSGKMDVEDDEGFVDYKSTSNLQYAKTPMIILEDIQAMGYAYAWLNKRPDKDACLARYPYFQTRGAPLYKLVKMEISRADAEKFWHEVLIPKFCGVFLDYWKSGPSLLGVNGRRSCGAFNKACEYMDICTKVGQGSIASQIVGARSASALPEERVKEVQQYVPDEDEEKTMAFDPKKFMAAVKGKASEEPTPPPVSAPAPTKAAAAAQTPITNVATPPVAPPVAPGTSGKFDPRAFINAAKGGAVVPPDAPEDHAPGVQLNAEGTELSELEKLGLTPLFVERLVEIGIETAAEASRLTDEQVLAMNGIGKGKLAEFRKVFPQPLSKAGAEALEREKAAIAGERTQMAEVIERKPMIAHVVEEELEDTGDVEGADIEDYLPADTKPATIQTGKEKDDTVQLAKDAVKVQREAKDVTPTPRPDGLFLFVDCRPSKGMAAAVEHLSDIAAPYMAQVAELNKVVHYTCVDYAKGPGQVLAMLLEQETLQGRSIVIETGTQLGRCAVETLRPLAAFVVEGSGR